MLNARQALLKASVLESESLVVDAQTVKDGCVDITNMCPLFFNIISPRIGLAPVETAFDTAASHPDAEAATMVIATGSVAANLPLAV